MKDRFFPATTSSGQKLYLDPYEINAVLEAPSELWVHSRGTVFRLPMTADEFFEAFAAWDKATRLARLQAEVDAK